jgi:2,5-diketo-D-gluconate reductase A
VNRPSAPNPGPAVRTLADGNEIPLLGLGVWQIPNGPECVDAVRWALEDGYRHIDTAQAYGNEESVGRGLREAGVSRENVFITTKFFPGSNDPAAELEGSLRRLGVEHVDMYIVHWPQGGPTWAWPGMEQARARGHTRSIGVSNYSASELGELRQAVKDWSPVADQVQFSPFEYRSGLLRECDQHDVVLEAYSPLGTGRHLSNADVTQIAGAHGISAAQVLLRWCVQRAIPVIPKSTNRDRIATNARIFDFELSAAEMAALDALDTSGGTDRARESKWW